MNYFLDTEFTCLPWAGDARLVSIGLVREDDKKYFACLNDFDAGKKSEFFVACVEKLLPAPSERKPQETIAQDLIDYFDIPPTKIWSSSPDVPWVMSLGFSEEVARQVVSQYSDYDLKLIQNLMGPCYLNHWPKQITNIDPLKERLARLDQLPANPNQHDSSADAEFAFEIWKRVQRLN